LRTVPLLALQCEIPNSANYHLFLEGVKPMWEDPTNAKGGKWVFATKRRGVEHEALNAMWLNTLMCILGEQFASADNDQITGAVFSVRKAADRMVGELSSANGEPSYSRLLHWPSIHVCWNAS
jgi:translation initiation factor 4E